MHGNTGSVDSRTPLLYEPQPVVGACNTINDMLLDKTTIWLLRNKQIVK